jgi:hypothetical protein
MGSIWEVGNDGRMKLKSFSSNPSGSEGMIIYNSTDKVPYYHDGTQWNAFGGSGATFLPFINDAQSFDDTFTTNVGVNSTIDWNNSTCFYDGTNFCFQQAVSGDTTYDAANQSSVDVTKWTPYVHSAIWHLGGLVTETFANGCVSTWGQTACADISEDPSTFLHISSSSESNQQYYYNATSQAQFTSTGVFAGGYPGTNLVIEFVVTSDTSSCTGHNHVGSYDYSKYIYIGTNGLLLGVFSNNSPNQHPHDWTGTWQCYYDAGSTTWYIFQNRILQGTISGTGAFRIQFNTDADATNDNWARYGIASVDVHIRNFRIRAALQFDQCLLQSVMKTSSWTTTYSELLPTGQNSYRSTAAFSADNGVNYTAYKAPHSIVQITNTGTSCKYRCTLPQKSLVSDIVKIKKAFWRVYQHV